MYPIVLMCLSSLSATAIASFPQVFESSLDPPVPNPILELQELQSFSLLAMMPIRALKLPANTIALNPSLLQLCCKEVSETISLLQV